MEVALKDFMYVSNKLGCTQGELGVETRPLSLVFKKNFFTWQRRLTVFAYFLLVNLST